MKDIKLKELPKSKIFMNNVKVADRFTKQTKLESGFMFCKPKDKIIIDNICKGTECSVDVTSKKCGPDSNDFHTHPVSKPSDFSSDDTYEASRRSYILQESNIYCVKSIHDKNVICKKINSPVNSGKMSKIALLDDVREIIRIDDNVNLKSFIAIEKALVKLMDKINKPEHILFDSNTGKVIQENTKK